MTGARWLGAVLLACAGVVQGQPYPSQPIRLIVPWPPGGGVDTAARIISQPLGQRLGQSIVIENRPGAAATSGPSSPRARSRTAIRSSWDRSARTRSTFTCTRGSASIREGFRADRVRHRGAEHPGRPGQLAGEHRDELIAEARANPGKLNYGSAGVGSSQHLAAAMLIASTKINIVHVPYKGTSAAETDLIAGHIALLLDTTACLPFIAAGKMKALAVAAKARNPALPNVPTFDELGIPGVLSGAWYGVMAPAGTPREVVDRVNAEMNALLRTPEMRKRLADFGGEPGGGTPEDFGQFMAAETVRYADIVKLSGAKME